MRKSKVGTVWIPALILAVLMAGCGDPDKNASAGNPGGPLTPPRAAFVTPPDGNVGVCPNANPVLITAIFSKPMNPSSLNTSTFTVTGPGGAVAGAVTYVVATNTATFTPTPSSTLAPNTPFTGTITTGATDTFGNMLATNFTWTFTTSVLCSPPPPSLGTACGFGILGGSTVTNTGPTVITGGVIGLSPGTSVTGFPPGMPSLAGSPSSFHVTDPIAAQAQLDALAAYNAAAGAAVTQPALAGDLMGLTLAPGVWKNSSAVMLSTGTVTLDAGAAGSGAVWIFQIGSMLTTGSGTQVILKNGALAKNIIWQVGSSATLGTTSIFYGTIMTQASITITTGATLNGRALALTPGSVTLDSNPVNVPPCL